MCGKRYGVYDDNINVVYNYFVRIFLNKYYVSTLIYYRYTNILFEI